MKRLLRKEVKRVEVLRTLKCEGGQVLTSYINFLLVGPMTWDQSVGGKVEVDPGTRYACGYGSKGIHSQPDPLTTMSCYRKTTL